ncbi:hypothetical protein [Massilia sp. H6]|uniref:hypothetical protein n=1 Tax=Massilia sp. H6 TaxID=2970464 RepID=UPI002168B5C9|nr:hypothetical protein [Massilia sp. H6]UVW27394.1 hypothetical protein NRS07_12575 [Massilia sp. H6]
MKPSNILTCGALAALAMLASGCDRGGNASVNGIEQTRYPGQVTAGGLSSGTIIAAAPRPVTDAVYAGGTPGHAGGAGGTSSGAETAGTVRETGVGPSRGVTPPTGAQEGTKTPPGEYPVPVPPVPGTVRSMPASNAGAEGPAAPGPLKGQQ